MSSTDRVNLTEDQIDDLLYFARTGELSDFQATLDETSSGISAPAATVLAAAIDEYSGNTVLHMAAANGHDAILLHVLRVLGSEQASSTSSCLEPGASDSTNTQSPSSASSSRSIHSSSKFILDHPNSSGSTPLHWAALNGQLACVRLLADGGADLGAENAAKHDALDEAERAGRRDVIRFLMARMSGKTEAEIDELERKREEEEEGDNSGATATAGGDGGVRATQRDLERLGLGLDEGEDEDDGGGVKIGG